MKGVLGEPDSGTTPSIYRFSICHRPSSARPSRPARRSPSSIRTISLPSRLPIAAISSSKLFGPSASAARSEEHTSELQSLMRISYAVFCLTKKHTQHTITLLTDDHAELRDI